MDIHTMIWHDFNHGTTRWTRNLWIYFNRCIYHFNFYPRMSHHTSDNTTGSDKTPPIKLEWVEYCQSWKVTFKNHTWHYILLSSALMGIATCLDASKRGMI